MSSGNQSLSERQRDVLAQGKPATLSKDSSQFIEGIYPTHVVSANKCWLVDDKGESYLDFICGLGAMSLGYGNEYQNRAVREQLLKGVSFSLPHVLEVEVAELIRNLVPDMERLRFLKNGDDATRAAVRVARAYTGRSLVLSDGYHGHSDIWTSLTPPAKGVSDVHQIHKLDLDDPDIPSDTACVIVEALKLEMTDEYKAKLMNIRQKCKEKGVVFIMDEIVTNCRVPQWTISNLWQLKPDLICLGKGISNGFPLAVLGGQRDLMNSDYFVSTTFGGEALSLASTKAVIHELFVRNFDDLMFYGKRLMKSLNDLHPKIQWKGYGTRGELDTSTLEAQLFMQECVKSGVLFGRAFFFNFSHLSMNVESFVMGITQSIVEKIKQGHVKLEGRPPQVWKR